MAMTETDRVTKRLTRLIIAAHSENYDFVYIPVGTAKLIVRLLNEKEAKHEENIHGTTENGAEAGDGDGPAEPDRDGDLR